MAKFRLFAKSVDYLHVDVEAKDEDEARDMYDQIDGGSFINDGGYFDFDNIEPLDDDAEVDFKAGDIL